MCLRRRRRATFLAAGRQILTSGQHGCQGLNYPVKPDSTGINSGAEKSLDLSIASWFRRLPQGYMACVQQLDQMGNFVKMLCLSPDLIRGRKMRYTPPARSDVEVGRELDRQETVEQFWE